MNNDEPKRIDLRAVVEREIAVEWADFSARHPALASELGQAFYVSEAMSQLSATDEYVAAMRNGQLTEVAATTVVRWVREAVRVALGR